MSGRHIALLAALTSHFESFWSIVHIDEQSCKELSECFLCRRKIPSKEAKKWELYATAEWRLRENWHIQRPFTWKAWTFFSLFLVKLGSKLQTRNPLKEFLGKILSSFVTILSIGVWIVVIGRKIYTWLHVSCYGKQFFWIFSCYVRATTPIPHPYKDPMRPSTYATKNQLSALSSSDITAKKCQLEK